MINIIFDAHATDLETFDSTDAAIDILKFTDDEE